METKEQVITQCKYCKYNGHMWHGRIYCTVHKNVKMYPTDFCSKAKPREVDDEIRDN